jgi:hypothetical protein
VLFIKTGSVNLLTQKYQFQLSHIRGLKPIFSRYKDVQERCRHPGASGDRQFLSSPPWRGWEFYIRSPPGRGEGWVK